MQNSSFSLFFITFAARKQTNRHRYYDNKTHHTVTFFIPHHASHGTVRIEQETIQQVLDGGIGVTRLQSDIPW